MGTMIDLHKEVVMNRNRHEDRDTPRPEMTLGPQAFERIMGLAKQEIVNEVVQTIIYALTVIIQKPTTPTPFQQKQSVVTGIGDVSHKKFKMIRKDALQKWFPESCPLCGKRAEQIYDIEQRHLSWTLSFKRIKRLMKEGGKRSVGKEFLGLCKSCVMKETWKRRRKNT